MTNLYRPRFNPFKSKTGVAVRERPSTVQRWFKLTIAYDGTNYAGWQVQPDQVTIQSELHRALERIAKQKVSAIGSGRTDAGVHAFAQVASCKLDQWNASAASLKVALNTQLPDDIVITESIDAPTDFHAIRDAIGKRYRYQIRLGRLRNAFDYRYRWHWKHPLEIESMRQAAQTLLGEHDFACFQASGGDRKSTVRKITACDLLHEPGEQELAIEVEANGFLYNMVRNIVGTLIEVGRGKRPPEWVQSVIDSKDRNQAGPTAPPQGLFLQRVDYPDFDGST